MTYGDVCVRVMGKDSVQVRVLLGQLGLTDHDINGADTLDMLYSIDNFPLKHSEQIPPNEKEGVLLVDCKRSVYIDRPVVFYLGMGTEWDKDLSDLDLVDYRLKDDIVEQDTDKFQILLQQGSVRLYFCNSVKEGKPAKPCSMFAGAETDDPVYERFSDIAECTAGSWAPATEILNIESGTHRVDTGDVSLIFSKSSYDSFVNCPRQFMFGQILGSPDRGDTAIGNMLHEYAEFRICYPEKVKELGKEYFVDAIAERCIGLFTPDQRSLRRSKISSSIDNINGFVESRGFSDRVVMTERKDRNKPNMFFHLAGREDVGSQMNERRLESLQRHMQGILDVLDGKDIYDFKTGTKKSLGDAVKALRSDGKNQYGIESQPLFYLSLLEDSTGERGNFTLMFTAANDRIAALGGTPDPENCIISFRTVPDRYDFARQHLFSDFLTAKKYDRLRPLESGFFSAMDAIGVERLLSSEPDIAVSTMILRLGLKDNETNKGAIKGALDRMYAIMTDSVIVTGTHGSKATKNIAFVPQDTIEEFRGYVSDAYDKAVECYDGTFEARPTMPCKNCEFRDVCTADVMEVEDDE